MDERSGTPDGWTERYRSSPPPPPPLPAPTTAGPGASAGTPTSAELTHAELTRSLVRPDLLASHVLGSADRIACNLSAGTELGLLLAALALASVAAALPFGAVAPVGEWWSVAALFTGSLLVCFPCLHVLLEFLGFRISLASNLSLALTISATAAIFTLGFAPIVWFIDFTTRARDDSAVTPSELARLLLVVSLLMGVVQMGRCLAACRIGARGHGGLVATVLLWLPLVLFISWRMAGVLGLRA